MKDTGVVRRVDDLGRIVIPKEIRKTAKIKTGDAIEFYVSDASVILKKYSPIEKSVENVMTLVNSVREVLEKECLITDLDNVVACSENLTNLLQKPLTEKFIEIIKDKKSVVLNKKDDAEFFAIVKAQDLNEESRIIVPIICKEEVLGAIVILSFDKEDNKLFNEVNLARLCATLLSSQLN